MYTQDPGPVATRTSVVPPPPAIWDRAARLSAELHVRLGVPPPAEPDEATLVQPLHAAFSAVVRRAPGALAATDGTRAATYADLWRRALAWAALIHDAAPPPGPLALLMPADPFYMAGVLGCLMAGHPCLPLDPANPPARLHAILRSAGIGVVLTWGASDLDTAGMRRIGLDDAPPAPAFTPMPLGPDAAALLIATSGSTGVPKVVVHSQRTITHRVWMRIRAGNVTAADRYYFGAGSATNIADIAHILSALLSGACVVLINLTRVGIRGFLEQAERLAPTIVRCGMSLMRTLLVSPQAPTALRSVRMARLAGEQLLRSDVERLRGILRPGCAIVTSYGSTELAGHFGWVVRDDDATDPIRVPAAGIESARDLVVLDEAGAMCAPGEIGEIVVRSRYNAIGEWIDGRLVAGRLIPDPVDPTLRVYATGDLGYRGAGGALVIVGRADRQFKVNGVRIDPSETEVVLRDQPEVRDAMVLVRPAASAPTLLAFVLVDDPTLDVAALRDRLRGALPAPLLPSRIVALEQFPRLPNGKVDGVTLLAGVADG